MNPSDWLDTGRRPPQRLPDSVDAALEYLAHALGHPLYCRWTLTMLKRGCPSVSDAKREHPAVFALLLDHDAAIEYRERGRLRAVPEAAAPSAATVLERTLRQHRRRFRHSVADEAPEGACATPAGPVSQELAPLPAGVAPAWLARAGRFANPLPLTNTLGVADDAQAVKLFLRERASHSPHTLRAYASELRRLAAWCGREQLGPFSDLTRQDLMAYRDALQAPHAGPAGNLRRAAPASISRALAAVSSLFAWWHRTGYLTVNPAEGLAAGRRARMTWTPVRFLPAAALAHCDALAADAPADVPPVLWLRRCAIWALYRYAGVRLAELVWNEELALAHVAVDEAGQWTLHVLGKGQRLRAISLPSTCLPALRSYRRAVGLPPDPPASERLPLIHSERGRALGASGLYDEVHALFTWAATRVPVGDRAMRAALEVASTHWLRHG
jgi:site-specific recombinase XerD